jgi:excisionase family DNA binding protein
VAALAYRGSGVAVDDEYLNARDAARYLDVSPTTLYRLIHMGKLPTFRSEVNRRERRIRRVDLDRLRIPRPAEETS